jgi:CubicO group peptidase (beta-lactamase class C family)
MTPGLPLLRLALATLILSSLSATANAQASLNVTLEPYLAEYNLPALAAAVVKDGEIVVAGAVGTRKLGARIPVNLDDRFHLGSDTKAMTALLAAMFVEEGKLKWGSTVGDVFPEFSEKMDPGLRRVTLEQLLSHTGGLPGDEEDLQQTEALFNKAMLQPGNLDDMRYWVVKEWAGGAHGTEPGARFVYSNLGYLLAGAMLERVAGRSWEEMINDRIFAPLGLRTAGFGPQATLGRVDAPLGHATTDGKIKVLLAGPNGDNPAVLGPAGTAHMSALDFARSAGWNAGGGRRGPKLISEETMTKLRTPVVSLSKPKNPPPGTPSGGRYALGWGEVTVDWAPEPLVYHGGSNGMNLALIFISPGRDFAMVMVTNIGGTRANEGLFAVAASLYAQYVAK